MAGNNFLVNKYMPNGLSTNARVVFTMFSDVQVAQFNISSLSSGSNQIGESITLPLSVWTPLNTSSLSDIKYSAFINEGSGSIAVRIAGSSTDLTYLNNKSDGSFICLQSGSCPALIATSYISQSILTYKLQES